MNNLEAIKFIYPQLFDCDDEIFLDRFLQLSHKEQSKFLMDDYFLNKIVRDTHILVSYIRKSFWIKKDRHLIMRGLKFNPDIYKHAHKLLKKIDAFALEALMINPSCFKHLLPKHKEDCYFLNHAIELNIKVIDQIAHFPPNARANFKLMTKVIQHNPMYLAWVHRSLTHNMSLTLEAVSRNGFALQYAPKEIRRNEYIALTALKNNMRSARFINTGAFKSLNTASRVLKLFADATIPLPKHIFCKQLLLKKKFKSEFEDQIFKQPVKHISFFIDYLNLKIETTRKL